MQYPGPPQGKQPQIHARHSTIMNNNKFCKFPFPFSVSTPVPVSLEFHLPLIFVLAMHVLVI